MAYHETEQGHNFSDTRSPIQFFRCIVPDKNCVGERVSGFRPHMFLIFCPHFGKFVCILKAWDCAWCGIQWPQLCLEEFGQWLCLSLISKSSPVSMELSETPLSLSITTLLYRLRRLVKETSHQLLVMPRNVGLRETSPGQISG